MPNVGNTLFYSSSGASRWNFSIPRRTCCTKTSRNFFLSLCTALTNIPDSFRGQKKASCVCADCELSSLGQAAHRPPAIVLGVCGLHDSCTDVFICLRASRLASQPVNQPASQPGSCRWLKWTGKAARCALGGRVLLSLQTLLLDVPPPSAPLRGPPPSPRLFLCSSQRHMSRFKPKHDRPLHRHARPLLPIPTPQAPSIR